MNLTKEECERLTSLLSDKKIDLPEFRRSVTITGCNYAWLQKHIRTRNKNLHPEIVTLLKL
jgi:hypothetical protein